MFFPPNKKGITPVIAIILLLILTVSAAGTAFYWLTLIEGKLASEEQVNIKEYGVVEGGVNIVATQYNSNLGQLTIFFKNIGGINIPIENVSKTPTTLWLLKDYQNKVICSTDWSGSNNGPICIEGCIIPIAPDETRQVILNNLGPSSLCNIAAQPSESLLQYSVDFSGKAVAKGGFVK